jgi:hypothetical protein
VTGSGLSSSWLNLLSIASLRTAFRYFSTVAPGMGCDEQNGLPVSMGTMQRQPVWQALVALHPPPQVAKPLASLRNCRAETVPAQRTPMTNAEKNVDLIFFMIAFLLVPGPNVPRSGDGRLFSRFGCDEIAHPCRESGLNDTPAAQNVGAGLCLAAEMVLASCVLNIQRQLACGNRSRTESSSGHRRKDYVFDFLITHESLPFHCRSNEQKR